MEDNTPQMSPEICDLRTIEQMSLKVVEASPDALVVINEEGTVIIFNYQAELMFGYAREEIIGKSVELLLPESKRDIHRTHRGTYFTSPRVREMGLGMVLEGRHRRGYTFQLEIKLAPLAPAPGTGVCALAVVRRVIKPTNAYGGEKHVPYTVPVNKPPVGERIEEPGCEGPEQTPD